MIASNWGTGVMIVCVTKGFQQEGVEKGLNFMEIESIVAVRSTAD